jgi:hypothetical protein
MQLQELFTPSLVKDQRSVFTIIDRKPFIGKVKEELLIRPKHFQAWIGLITFS